MAFQARHRWMIQRLQLGLGFQDETHVEELMRGNGIMEQLSRFFRADGPTKIFFYYQAKGVPGDDTLSSSTAELLLQQQRDKPARKELFVTDGLDETLQGRAVFFAKVAPDPADTQDEDRMPWSSRGREAQSEAEEAAAADPATDESFSYDTAPRLPLDPAVANDHLLTYGVLDSSVLLSIETHLSQLFVPMLAAREESEWGQAESDARNEFMLGLKSFVTDVQENLKAMNTGLDLRKPDKRYDPSDTRSLSKLSSDDGAVQHFVELVKDWCKQTEAYLEDNDQGRWESHEAGPATELEYWKRRLQRLMGITEQLKTKECKMVTGVLNVVSKLQDGAMDKLGITQLLRQWKQIDTNITEASNEAKDNVKYLATLERFIEPLYTGTPTSVVDALPALMNSVKMIHTIARYYNTTERMTKLFMKITNQMITLCKNSLVGREPPEAIWEKDPEDLLLGLESCLKLNEAYQEQYRLTKDKLLTMPKGKQFDFSETQIFGKFDLFCRRLVKLIDMFSTIHQFRALAQHSLEGMDALLASFNTIIREFRAHKHDLLDFHNNKFDRDYVEFNIQIADLEASLQQFINVSFDSITSIEQSLQLLKQFQQILQRETLRSDLDSKFTVIFHNYGLDLSHVQELYERHRHDPPVARNLPPVAGNILWSRHLLRRIEEPMRKFESNPTVLSTKDSKKIIKTYNKVARTLVAFEYLWYEAWCRSVESARAGLHATLIIRHPETGRLFVNFDKEILQLIREARCLDRMGIEVPENARMVMLQEDKFKAYYNDLSYALHEYDRVTAKIIPVTAVLLRPHLEDLQQKLRPGLVTLTWTSMNIDAYTAVAHAALQRLEELISSVLDAIENRIEKNLVLVSKASLVHLPTDQSFALDDFVRMQEKHVANVTRQLAAKNVEIENAVEDVLRLICDYNLDGSSSAAASLVNSGGVSATSVSTTIACNTEAMETFRNFYRNLFYRSLVTCTKQSLDAIKKRVCSKAGTGFLFLERPFFEVDVQLSVPSVRLSPSLDDIQKAINRSAVAVLRCSKSLYEWGQQSVFPETARTSLFERLGCDTEIIKVAILLTGALHGTKNQVHEYLSAFKKYDWLWKEDMEFRYNQFMQRNPLIQDFETELRHFMAVEAEISLIAPVHNIAVLSLNTKNLKLQLRNECRQWKVQYSDKVHQQARTALFNLTDYIRTTTSKLSTRVESLDALRFVMGVLKEVRERESAIEMELNPIADMYDMLEHFLPGGYMDKDEMDQKSVLRGSWRKLVDYAEEVTDNLSEVQGGFKKQLIKDVKDFQADVAVFRGDYEANGPMASGLEPAEAVERLKRFKDLLGIRERKLEVFSAGEELFGMRPTEYPEIVRTRKEMALLDQLYGLYMDVERTMDEFRGIPWVQVGANVERMSDCFAGFDQRCKKMPKNLCEWEAYGILRKVIAEFLEVLPIVRELTRESIKPRHWEEIIKACNGQRLPYDNDSFKFQDVLDAKLLTWKEDVEYICESAQKQLQIEHKLRDLTDRWAGTAFEFSEWRARSVPVLKGYGQIIEDLEEGQLQLQAILSMRHVVFFKDRVQAKLAQLSDTADVLELWAKVQTLWMSLESVFTGGDIAKQMPLEAKKFAKIDKDWLKVMSKASEVGFVVACCSNELLRSTLPSLFSELEKCQKSLEGYLEQKRKKFPRFYFVSNPLLLLILSRGSDPAAVQQYYEKIFDSISQVVHERPMSASSEAKASSSSAAAASTPNAKRKIVEIKSLVGNDEETISLVQPVLPDGNIEDWLGMLEKEMRRTLKTLCRQAAADCSSGSLREFVSKTCAQFALLGIQLSWTAECQDALQRCRTTKGIMAQTAKRHGTMLSELSSWCLTDLGTKLTRTKVETLITIQVHQRDCFLELCRLYKEKKLSDANDFEWLKQARFYWRVGGQGAFDSVGPDACLISICDVDFKYAFEYLGCKERLVITPLTDRAYITLSQALGMHLGGAPAGPAGTGKTETVKDLGRSLGVYVIVTNCTDQQRYSDMAKIFKGLCQGGLWGCFDEFNRIELPVLSVVAQQVLAITNAKRVQAPTFTFPGDPLPIGLHTDAAYFITMNPGYQGRQELPENLKALFRGVAMMVPDREIIMKVRLCAVGYDAFAELARKFKTLYAVCEGQLSKQRHYDFGLRNILSVLRSAGATKRDNLLASEELLMMTTLRDMNLSKLVAADVPIFLSLLRDIFPGVEPAPSGNGQGHSSSNEIAGAIEDVLQKTQSWPPPATWSAKVTQLYETQLVRHGIALVGPAGSGKSEILRTLQTALGFHTRTPHRQVRLNPKAVRAEELFGETDRLSGEWVDGVFAAIWAKFNDRSRKDVAWLVCDGPVDAVWIENLNTVLDDNKLLTLANGDRLPMTDNCKLLFEVEDLRNASPATVSRAGIVYVSDTDLDWEPVAQRWLRLRPDSQRAALARSIRTLVGGSETTPTSGSGHLFEFLSRRCRPVMNAPRVALIQSCLNLLQSLMERCELSEHSAIDMELELERLFAFSLAWAVGGVLDLEDRVKLHYYLVEKAPATTFPPLTATSGAVATTHDSHDTQKGTTASSNSAQPLTIFDHFLHPSTLEWEKWALDSCENLLARTSGVVNVGRLIIPTTDTARALHLLEHLHASQLPVLLVGEPGTGKSTLARLFFESRSSGSNGQGGEGLACRTLIFSGATLGGAFQATVEGDLEKRGGKTFGPSNGQQLTLFMDDLSMPALNEWGDQPTLEVVRQLVETRTLCFLDKDKRGDIKVIEGLRFLAAMGLPLAGKNDAPARLKRHFFILNLLPPSPEVAEAIFAQLTRWRFLPDMDGSSSTAGIPKKYLFDLINRLAAASVQLWLWLRRSMPPTPQKFHYVFSLRELSRSFQGLLRAPVESATASDRSLVRLWQHESERVFADRLVSLEDKQRFCDELTAVAEGLVSKLVGSTGSSSSVANKEKTDGHLPHHSPQRQQSVHSVLSARQAMMFVDFLQDQPLDEFGEPVGDLPRNYEPVSSVNSLRTRVEHLLAQFNRENPGRALPPLILFEEALFHLARLTRVLGLAQSNMMLVGVGGSGKQSLARLAAALSGHELCQLAVTKAYTLSAFLDDLRGLCKTAGQVGKGVVFLLTEADIKDDSFLEQVNALLATGEVPGLFPRDELVAMASELRGAMQRECPDRADTLPNLTRFFHDRVRRNLHVVLCLSPVSSRFADRCREFPHLVNGCTIDWFLPWPEEALTAVSQGYLDKFGLETPPATKEALVVQMGRMHQAVEKVSGEYFMRRRRRVVQTPRSFLSFLTTYKELYAEKLSGVRHQEGAVNLGLHKLGQGAQDVERMKVVLKEEEAKLVAAEAAANKMLETLQVKSLEAKKENDIVQQIREQCLADAAIILAEKEAAEEDLKRAQPFLDEAERAASSIRPNDLNELKKLAKPGDIIKLIFDCVAILQMAPLLKVERAPVTLGVGKEKHTCDFLLDSFQIAKSGMLADTRFLQNIFYFSKHQKDQMNDETLELMAPYMELAGFSAPVAKNASKAAEGLFCWVKAMSMYHEASKVVKPKLEALRIAEGKFEAAQARLQSSEDKLQKCQNVLTRLQEDFQTQMAEKARVEAFAQATKRKMEQATALIGGLGGEKVRWTEDSNRFVERKQHLVGDCALAAAFLCYCGPFNREYRDLLLRERLPYELGVVPTLPAPGASGSNSTATASLAKPSFTIPLTRGLALEEFLADAGTVSDWKMQGLPSDPLSIQNGLLVARAPRFPLLIDPQGQALAWVLRREAERLPSMGVVSVSSPKLREILEHCVGEGKALVLDGVDGADPDPMMANVLDKNFVVRAKGKFVKIMDRLCEYQEDFALYLTTRVPNPHFSPELQARTLVVDFTVTQKGLEEQLLAQVIRQEQRSLEEQLERVQFELNANAKALVALDALLLERLSASKANLLDDVELVSVLANTKAKATEVNDKILAAEEVKRGIDEKREHYRPVAARGSVLYFGIVDFAAVNAMYQTSLDQFLQLFVRGIEEAERSALASKRVTYILETLTYIVFRYVNRGLYDRHRLSFLLMIALKILVAADCVTPADVTLFLKAGASRKLSSDQPKPFGWMPTGAWLNAVQLASEKPHFRNLLGDLERSESAWRKWFEDNEPERLAVPDYEGLLFDPRAITANLHFHRLLLVRSLREDRTIPAVLDFIRAIEFIEGSVGVSLSRVPALGPRYAEPITDTVESVYQEMKAETPVLYLLSPGADPTESIEQLARRKRQSVTTISMGEGQEAVAARTVASAMLNGSWVLLQNCHLGLNYLDSLCEALTGANGGSAGNSGNTAAPARAPEFRLFLTSEPHPDFPIALLHRSTKVTNEPPAGLRAGLLRSFTVLVDQDKLDRLESPSWRSLLFAVCFLHAVVVERRKFGPLGFSVPYEFNAGDMGASLSFLERHLFTSPTPSWPTVQYMVAEVHYGGRIMDELDRRLFRAYCDAWFNPTLLGSSFSFNPEVKLSTGTGTVSSSGQLFNYCLPESSMAEIEEYHRFIAAFPSVDSPEVFGLHPNADLTYRVKEVSALLGTIVDTQPTDADTGSGNAATASKPETREDIIQQKIRELLSALPQGGDEALSEESLGQALRSKVLGGGLELPLNLFLCQEARALRHVLKFVRASLIKTQRALAGEVLLTSSLRETGEAIFDGKVPPAWVANEQAWLAGTLGLWVTGLIDRVNQLRVWLDRGRPSSFWLAGFSNPQGFLTAVAQESTRAHASERWALDDVVYYSEVTDYERLEQIKQPPREGVLVHGLMLDGAAWNRPDGTLVEQEPKRLFAPLPAIYVTAATKAHKKTRAAQDHGPYGAYEAPVYRYARRTDKHYIFSVPLASRDHRPLHWTLRGVALLCSTDQ